MVRFGMPALIELETVEQTCALCRELGLEFVELNTNFPMYLPDRIEADKLARLAEQNNIFYTIHLDDNMSTADLNRYVAEAYCRTAYETVDIAKRLHVPVLNMHLAKGGVVTLPDRKVYVFGQYQREYLDNMARFRDECTRAVGSSGIRICVENCDGYEDFHKAALDVLLESPVFGLTLDIGHNHGADYVDEPLVMENRHRLHHMHMHDAYGKKDHQALGAGSIDIPKYLVLATQCDCTVVLETKTVEGLRGSVRWLKEKGIL